MHVALLRGINVGGRNSLPMVELRSLAATLGFADVRTYIQSGNLLFRSEQEPDALQEQLQAAICTRFGLDIPVIVRSAGAWPALLAGNPYPDASTNEPHRVMLALAARPLAADVVPRLQARAIQGERIARVGETLWLHFPAGAGTSKLSTSLLDRASGSPVTMRNWRTALKLGEMLGAEDPAPRD